VMISLGINRLEKEEEIQRYQFRRLISSSATVELIYQESPDKERSRFIEELIWEKQKQKESLQVIPIPRAVFKVAVLPKKQEVPKAKEAIAFLKTCEYSASSVNTYLHCPLKFYYQYVLGLKEKEDLLDEPEAKDIGTFVHELLAEMFERFLNKAPRINAAFRKDFFARLEEKFESDFARKMKSDAFLVKQMLRFSLERFLDKEDARRPASILCLEKRYKGKIKAAIGEFRFQAIIDRIDQLEDGTTLILDYKTGGSDIMPLTNAERIERAGFSREALKSTVKSFQLPLYLYLVGQEESYQNKKMNAALYFIKDAGKESGLKQLFKTEEDYNGKDRLQKLYGKAIEELLGELLDPGIPFVADERDLYFCQACPFSYLCR